MEVELTADFECLAENKMARLFMIALCALKLTHVSPWTIIGKAASKFHMSSCNSNQTILEAIDSPVSLQAEAAPWLEIVISGGAAASGKTDTSCGSSLGQAFSVTLFATASWD